MNPSLLVCQAPLHASYCMDISKSLMAIAALIEDDGEEFFDLMNPAPYEPIVVEMVENKEEEDDGDQFLAGKPIDMFPGYLQDCQNELKCKVKEEIKALHAAMLKHMAASKSAPFQASFDDDDDDEFL